MSIIYNKKVETTFSRDEMLALDGQSRICNWLYNKLLDDCIDDYENHGNSKKLLMGRNLRDYSVALKNDYSFLKTVYASNLKEVSARLLKSYDGFFKNRRGYPKHRSWKRKWFSLVYDDPNAGWEVSEDGRSIELSLGKTIDKDGNLSTQNLHIVGHLKEVVVLNENELFKTLSVVKQHGRFYCVFAIERCSNAELKHKEEMTRYRKNCNQIKKQNKENEEQLEMPSKPILEKEELVIPNDCKWIAIDPNHENFFMAIDHNGETIRFEKLNMIKYWDKTIDVLKSKRDRCQKYYKKKTSKYGKKYTVHSPRWNRMNNALERAYDARREQIKSALYSIAHLLYDNYDLVIIGDYVPSNDTATEKNMKRDMLNQTEIGKFRQTLEWVATKEEKFYLMVDEHNTTKRCCICGHLEKKDPNVRTFTCTICGSKLLRDINSAINIAEKAGFFLSEEFKQNLNQILYRGTIRYGQKAKLSKLKH